MTRRAAKALSRQLAFALAIAAVPLSLVLTHARLADAKTPGGQYCYGGICHQVMTVKETSRLVGQIRVVETSFYDHPSVDRFNIGKYTSDGEEFDAGSPARAASSNLPDGTEVLVRNPVNGRTSHIRINDFGPFKVNRKLDVTRRVAEDLGFAAKGVTNLELYIITAPLPEDLVYRKNRSALEPLGHLGVVDQKNVASVVARLIEQRTRMPLEAVKSKPEVLAEVARPSGLAIGENREPLKTLAAIGTDARSTLAEASGTMLVATREIGADGAIAVAALAMSGRALVDRPIPVVQAFNHQETALDRLNTAIARWAKAPLKHRSITAAFAVAMSMALLAGWILVAPSSSNSRLSRTLAEGASETFAADTPPASRPSAMARLLGNSRIAARRIGSGSTRAEKDEPTLPAPRVGSLIAMGDVIEGSVTSLGSIGIEGELRGDVVADRCEIWPGGSVDGDITAREVIIEGAVQGRIVARKLKIAASARLVGEVRAETIDLAPGADVHARLVTGSKAGFEPELQPAADSTAEALTPVGEIAAAAAPGSESAQPQPQPQGEVIQIATASHLLTVAKGTATNSIQKSTLGTSKSAHVEPQVARSATG